MGVRVKEVKELIDDMEDKDFMKKLFGMDVKVGLNMERLIVSGHSMGGATALLIGDQDPRVNCILTHDPWSKVIEDEIPKFDKVLSKHIQITTTAQYALVGHDDDPFGEHFRSRCPKKARFESLIVDRTHHV